VLVAALAFDARALAAPLETGQWLPVEVNDGVTYEAQSRGSGRYIFRMSSVQLAGTMRRFQHLATGIERELAKLNLPAELKAAPGEAMSLLRETVREMGPDLRFYNPPSMDTRYGGMASFTFTDGTRRCQVLVAEAFAPSLASPMVSVKVTRKAGDKDLVEKEVNVQLNRAPFLEQADLKAGRVPWLKARLDRQVQSGDTEQKTYREYTALSGKPGAWFGVRSDGQRRASYVLRNADGTGREVKVAGSHADRLFILAALDAYRLPLPKSHRDYDPRYRTADDVRTALLRKAGLQVIVDKRGQAYVRRGPHFNAETLRSNPYVPLTFVKATADRRAHLRHLPVKR
jgi:hypothetical protein